MKVTHVLSVLLAGLVMIAILFSRTSLQPRAAQATIAANTAPIDTNAECSQGSISGQYCSIWYDWVNASDTQIVHYVLYSNVVNSPIISFLGQHFKVEDDTEVFVGSVMAMIEVYNDTNDDGIPQANFTSGVSEIKYYLMMNSSVSYEITDIQKTERNGVSHYTWGFEYVTIDGFLLYPEQQPGHAAARVMIDHVGLSYDFYVENNVSSLKTSFDIGNVTDIQQLQGEPPVSLEGLSLSLLFSTSTVAAKPHTIRVNGQEFNSTIATSPAIPASMGQVAVNMVKAYDFVFGETYNLTRGENVETHDVKSEAAAVSSVPQGALSELDWTLRFLEGNLNFTELFGANWGQINLNCNASALLYRICYPVWDGLRIQHDPTYVAYLFSTTPIPENPLLMVVSAFLATTLAAAWAKIRRRPRTRTQQ